MKKLILRKKVGLTWKVFSVGTADAARIIGVSESMMRKLRLNECGPKYAKIGDRVVYPVNELIKYVKMNVVK